MRSFRLAVVLLVLMAASTGYSHIREIVKKDFSRFHITRDGTYSAVFTMAVFPLSGNILHKQVFYFRWI